jgi:hypothetical protein
VGNAQGFSNRISGTKRLCIQQYQNSDDKKVNWRPARSYLVMPIGASLPNRLGPPPDAPLAETSVSELCLKRCVNVLGRAGLLVEKSNDDLLVVLDPLNENRKRTDLATMILNVLLRLCRCNSFKLRNRDYFTC